jgi:beta-galactosidase
LSLLALAVAASLLRSPHSFQVVGSEFQLDGKPFQIRSGEMHYARVPREYWRDRFKKMRAMGLNTVCTYAFWNLHEPERGRFDFTGNADIAEFVREAQQEGLWVLLRPGPYSCAEWEWGGFPYWLARIPGLKVRSDDPRFVAEASRYLAQLGKQLAPLQVNHGGPILMTQVENEYGSFGKDFAYKTAIKNALRKAGFDGQLYTADGPSDSMLAGGTLPDVLPTANFGGDPEGSFKELEKFRPGTPLMCGEFYPGWFDSWGKPHAHTSTEELVKDVGWMEDHHASYSLYMVHGGTTFGLMNGANWYDGGYWPQTTSYDYSTTIDEGGRPTEKFWAFRKVVQAHLGPGEKLPDLPPPIPTISIPAFKLKAVKTLWDLVGKPVKSERPLSFESLGEAYGFVLYETRLSHDVSELTLEGLQDRAQIFVQEMPFTSPFMFRSAGTVYRSHGSQTLSPFLAKRGDNLEILVENCGRINYGPQLLSESKGIGRVVADGVELTGWENYRLPPDAIEKSSLESHSYLHAPGHGFPSLYHGSFILPKTGDTFLDMREWGKGVVWINGHCLGRYWSIGPQQSLYVPAPWLKKGQNEVKVWETEPNTADTLSSVPAPIFELHLPEQTK